MSETTMSIPFEAAVLRRPGLSAADKQLVDAAIRCLEAHFQASGDCMRNPQAAWDYLRLRLYGLTCEVFAVLYLDNDYRVICYRELFRGTSNGASVYPREVGREALYRNASAVVLAHNHPDGNPEPSTEDGQITQRVQAALELVDVEILDHFVVGNGGGISMAVQGLL